MALLYQTTISPSTVINRAVSGEFLSRGERVVVVARWSQLDVLSMCSSGLSCRFEMPVFGRIVALLRLPPAAGTGDGGASPSALPLDRLFVATDDGQFAVLAYDAARQAFWTTTAGTFCETAARTPDVLASVDRAGELVVLHAYEGLLRVIPLEPGVAGNATFSLRLPEPGRLLDLVFLQQQPQQPAPAPTLALLVQDAREARHVRTLRLNVARRELQDGPWVLPHVEAGANMLIALPPPRGGLLVIAEQSIVYARNLAHPDALVVIAIKPVLIRAATLIDPAGQRLLLADGLGRLWLLALLGPDGRLSGPEVAELHLAQLVETICASTIAYLDRGVVLVGSTIGDAQLIRLPDDPTRAPDDASDRGEVAGASAQLLETYANLGPIIDAILVPPPPPPLPSPPTASPVAATTALPSLTTAHHHLMAACGAFKEGSLRTLRAGISLEPLATLLLPGVQRLFAVASVADEAATTTDTEAPPSPLQLIVSLAHSTRVFHCHGRDLDGEHGEDGVVELSGRLGATGHLLTDRPTLYVDRHVQITSSGVQDLVTGTAITLPPLLAAVVATSATAAPDVGDGPPPSTSTAATATMLTCADGHPPTATFAVSTARGGLIVMRRCGDWQLLGGSTSLPGNDHAAVLHLIPATAAADASLVLAVATWESRHIMIFALAMAPVADAALVLLVQAPLPGHRLARRLGSLADGALLLVGTGDGYVVSYYRPAPDALQLMRELALGANPITCLAPLVIARRPAVFAAGDRALLLRPLRADGGGEVAMSLDVFPVHGEGFRAATCYGRRLAVATASTVLLAQWPDHDRIGRVHATVHPVGQTVRRLAHDAASETVLLATLDITTDPATGRERDVGTLQLLQAGGSGGGSPLERLDTVALEPYEVAEAVLAGPEPGHYVVGTGYALPDEAEPSRGRLIAYRVVAAAGSNGGARLEVVAAYRTAGAVYCLVPLPLAERRIAAGIAFRVVMFALLAPETSGGHARWVIECEHADHLHVIALASHGNRLIAGDMMRGVVLLEYVQDEQRLVLLASEFRSHWTTAIAFLDDTTVVVADNALNVVVLRHVDTRLEAVVRYHLGDQINVLLRGTLAQRRPVDDHQQLLYGTVAGAVGALLTVPPRDAEPLVRLARAMAAHIVSLGRFPHATWRAFKTDGAPAITAHGVLDGDLLERFLELPQSDQRQVATAAGLAPIAAIHAVQHVAHLARGYRQV